MWPVLSGKQPSPRREMFWQRRSDKAARVGNWKWLESAKGQGLYDLTNDLGESNDLSQKMPDIAKMVQDRFLAWRETMDQAEPRGPFRNY